MGPATGQCDKEPIVWDELGQTVRGVSFTGRVRELPSAGIEEQISAFIAR
ncbi:hypothetical protein HS048_33980 [Planomonospora sp. ID91781]|nr:hypothetical protein [Planomonospora sp. ID91781]MBG0825696.1 hypothetical protein [Planomonospora sp. ID91781]